MAIPYRMSISESELEVLRDKLSRFRNDVILLEEKVSQLKVRLSDSQSEVFSLNNYMDKMSAIIKGLRKENEMLRAQCGPSILTFERGL